MEPDNTKRLNLTDGELSTVVKVVSMAITGSTNADIAELAKQGASPWTVVHALEQSAGRGRYGNTWISQKGNLYMSTLLRPMVAKKRWRELSFVMALAAASTIALFIESERVEVKWPNDVLVNDLKIAGILLEMFDHENCPSSIIVGIGINIKNAPVSTTYGATYLNKFLDQATEAASILKILLGEMFYWTNVWEKKGFDEIKKNWLQRAYKLGGKVEVSDNNEGTQQFTFIGIDKDGAILLRDCSGKITKLMAGTLNFF
ncbi:MAG: biotin--[acetyl-CoA-carboxylase] ligase [Rhodospirillaceae bacterium]|nr:biotin--[acetyl-CoA-carboxylase] ligase [Rhodospirillaceae bacterium]|tara:strand:- start:180 stop:959 length:780 start_codon:yes stop_codon:yes gene_type:complete